MSQGSTAPRRSTAPQRSTGPQDPGPGRLVRIRRRLPPQLALMLSAPILAVGALATTILAARMAALASSPAADRAASTVLCSGYARCARHGYDSRGYGRWQHRSFWRMPAGDQSTNYVAYVESTFFRVRTPDYLLGNAHQWPRSAAAHGAGVNNLPSAGAVAEWDGHASGPDGHVAVVEKVGPHDSYILISQQQLRSDADGYDWTRVNAGQGRHGWQTWPSHFIHFRIRRRL